MSLWNYPFNWAINFRLNIFFPQTTVPFEPSQLDIQSIAWKFSSSSFHKLCKLQWSESKIETIIMEDAVKARMRKKIDMTIKTEFFSNFAICSWKNRAKWIQRCRKTSFMFVQHFHMHTLFLWCKLHRT